MKIISKINSFLRNPEDKAGLLITIIIHLGVIIVLLAGSIHYQLRKDTSFLIDFSAQEEHEKAEELRKMKESVSMELDALLSESRTRTDVPRNVAVDASKAMKDDRNTDAKELYKDAEELQKRLDKSRMEAEKHIEDNGDVAISRKSQKKNDAKAYTGPSVLSWSLDGRKQQSLPIPAYQCQTGGDVTVSIIVDRKGYVLGCKVIEDVSSDDDCLREYALKAASRSRFNASDTAPEKQAGTIVYRFIAQ